MADGGRPRTCLTKCRYEALLAALSEASAVVLDALLENDVAVLSDCREGICGTCEVAVVEGDVEHRDFVVSERERAAGKLMMVCVSRARSARLVLDL